MTTLSLQPARVPLVDPSTGFITREWYRFFSDVFTIAVADNTLIPAELFQLIEDQLLTPKAQESIHIDDELLPVISAQVADDSIMIQPIHAHMIMETIESLQSELRYVSEQLSVAQNDINELRQGTML